MPSLTKALDVINSCTTHEQLGVAYRYLLLFLRIRPDCERELTEFYFGKCDEINESMLAEA